MADPQDDAGPKLLNWMNERAAVVKGLTEPDDAEAVAREWLKHGLYRQSPDDPRWDKLEAHNEATLAALIREERRKAREEVTPEDFPDELHEKNEAFRRGWCAGAEATRENDAAWLEEDQYHVDLPGHYDEDSNVIDDGVQNHIPESGDPCRCGVARRLRNLPLPEPPEPKP